MADLLRYEVITAVEPLTKSPPGTEAPSAPAPLGDKLFDQTDDQGRPLHVYAVLDGSNVKFLQDRLDQSDLPHLCLYTGDAEDQFGDTAPWLVELAPDAPLTRQFFTHDPDDPWQMLGLDPGIILRSAAPLKELHRHLRRYTSLVDENGVREFFRFHQPGMLDAVLQSSSEVEVAWFFANVHDVLYLIPSLTTDCWDAVRMMPGDGLPRADTVAGPAIPKSDAARRQAMRHVVNLRRARDLAIRTAEPVAEREARAQVYARLMRAGFEDATGLVKAFDLLEKIPQDAHGSFWEAVESGDYSLRFLLVKIARHYHLETVLK